MNESFIIGALVVLIIMIFSTVSSKFKSLESQIKNMKFTLEQIANQMEVPEHPINDKLRNLVTGGKDVQAVKEARQVFGLSLLEAKQYVDDLK